MTAQEREDTRPAWDKMRVVQWIGKQAVGGFREVSGSFSLSLFFAGSHLGLLYTPVLFIENNPQSVSDAVDIIKKADHCHGVYDVLLRKTMSSQLLEVLL